MNAFKSYLPLLLAALLCSCQRGVISSDHQNVSESAWATTDTVHLTLNVADISQPYDLAITLRHTELYTYQNLWFFIQSTDSLCPLQSDTVMACLANDRGEWLGRRVGRYYSGYMIAKRKLLFPHPGDYHFSVVQGMRDAAVVGIADVGMELRMHQPQPEEEDN